MQTKTTLYDILEVSANASRDTIRLSFERLKALYLADQLDSKGMDAGAYFQLIKDAYTTLSDADRREAYDQKLFGRRAPPVGSVIVQESVIESGGIPSVFKWGLVLLLLVGGAWYYKTMRDAERAIQLEQARLAAEQKAAELAAAERLKEAEEARLRRESEREAANQEARRLREIEAARREADRVSQRLEYAKVQEQRAEQRAEENKKRELERQEMREEQRRQREAEEARRRIEREKALARQMELENRSTSGRVATISSPTSTPPRYTDPRNASRY